jgi:hypothetical protein
MRLIFEAAQVVLPRWTFSTLDLLEQSLRFDPANASGWAYLAQGCSNDIEVMRGSRSGHGTWRPK